MADEKARSSPFMLSKRERLQELMDMTSKLCPIRKNKLAGMLEVKWGVKLDTALEYIGALIRSEHLVEDEKGVLKIKELK